MFKEKPKKFMQGKCFFSCGSKIPTLPITFLIVRPLFHFEEIMTIDNQLSWNVLPFLRSPTDQLCLGKPWFK